jgi:peptidoglycan/xylan/chitin deacetylase (PgdA/CDA1 family)
MSPLTQSRCAAAILVYHSIADVERDPFGVTVAPADFEGQLEVLARRFNVLSLTSLTEGLEHGRLPQRTVVVTFDDGYANNLEVARPALARHGLTATLFVATGYIGDTREFWWDEVERLVCVERHADADPVLELTVGAERLRCPMEDGAQAARRIVLWLEGLPAGSVEHGLAALRRWAGTESPPAPRPTHRPLKMDELSALAASAEFEIGAHTRSHLRLSAQTPEVQRAEIDGSRVDLESWLQSGPRSFAYPFGSPGVDYAPLTVNLVQDAGFDVAVSGSPELTVRSSPRYELPRWFVTVTEPSAFERWLANRFRPLPLRAMNKAASRLRGWH